MWTGEGAEGLFFSGTFFYARRGRDPPQSTFQREALWPVRKTSSAPLQAVTLPPPLPRLGRDLPLLTRRRSLSQTHSPRLARLITLPDPDSSIKSGNQLESGCCRDIWADPFSRRRVSPLPRRIVFQFCDNTFFEYARLTKLSEIEIMRSPAPSLDTSKLQIIICGQCGVFSCRRTSIPAKVCTLQPHPEKDEYNTPVRERRSDCYRARPLCWPSTVNPEVSDDGKNTLWQTYSEHNQGRKTRAGRSVFESAYSTPD